jgi:hypothetical protein
MFVGEKAYLFHQVFNLLFCVCFLLCRGGRDIGCRRILRIRMEQAFRLPQVSAFDAADVIGQLPTCVSNVRACCLSWAQPAFAVGAAMASVVIVRGDES